MLASQSNVVPTLASQPLPRHVRHLLTSVLKNASVDLERSVGAAITDFEQVVVRELERASFGAALDRWKLVLTTIERARPDIVRNFLANLEAELANLQQPQVVRGQLQTRYQAGDVLALVDDHEIEETSALTDAATRAELQNSLPLFLLGQRFGVLAGRPAFDAETLPIGPQGLCRSIRHAVERLGLDVDVRLMFYRSFERQVMPHYGALVDVINTDLAHRVASVTEHRRVGLGLQAAQHFLQVGGTDHPRRFASFAQAVGMQLAQQLAPARHQRMQDGHAVFNGRSSSGCVRRGRADRGFIVVCAAARLAAGRQ